MWRKICRSADERKQENECESKVGGKRLNHFFFCKNALKNFKDSVFEMEQADRKMRFYSEQSINPLLTEKERIQAAREHEKAGDELIQSTIERHQYLATLENCRHTIEIVEEECGFKFNA